MGSRNGTSGHDANYRYSVKFALKKKNGKAKTGFVMATVTHSGKRKRFSIVPPGESATDFNLPEEYWNKVSARPKRDAVNFQIVEARITEVVSDVKDYVNSCIRDGRPVDLDELANSVAGGISERQSVTVLLKLFIANRKITDKWNNERDMAKSTKMSYGTTLNNLKEYEKSSIRGVERQHPVTLDHFVLLSGAKTSTEPTVVKLFRRFLTEVKGYKDNSVSRELKNLAAFLKWAKREGFAGRLPIIVSIKAAPILGSGHALLPDEIDKLYALETKTGSRRWHVQQLFVLSFDTSLRFSDLHNLDPMLVNLTHQIVKNQKTGGTSVVFHTPRVREILTKYRDVPRSKMILPNSEGDFTQNWRFNSILKELAQEAGLDRIVQVENRTRGRAQVTQHLLHDVISSKFGRVSFISNALARGDGHGEVQIQTGHKDDKMLRKDGPYFRALHQEMARRMGIEEVDEQCE
ncbi:MAG: hypothetical protein IPI24_04160 [Ignavibacteria bacterium]|nr:hypothetical protein [Ignavibacteria bacterium]